jgi:hypothetical protein
MKKLVLIICLCLLGISLSAEKIPVLKELVNPDGMMIDDANIYISQDAEVVIYDARTFELKKKFGKKGQGPQEIPPFPFPMSGVPLMKINPLQDKLFIAAMGKIMYFSKQGEFIKESKFPIQKIQSYLNMFPLGSDIVCQVNVREKDEFFITASIVDENFQLKKELKRKKVNLHGGKLDLFSGSITFEAYKGRIYVASEDLAIDVFDQNGKLQLQIKHKHEPIKFNDDMRKQFDESLKFMFKSFYDQFKIIIYYPDYLPIIFNLQFSDPYLYVFTWNHQGEKRDLFIFKLDGTFVKQTSIPLKMVKFVIPYPFDIKDKTLFQLVDNEDTEEWELHQIPIH